MNLSEITRGQRVTYIPAHAKTRGHPDHEQGIVVRINEIYVFVLFDKDMERLGEQATSKACCPENLSV